MFGTHRDILFVSVYIPPTGSTFYDNKDGSDGIVLLQQALLEILVDNDGDIILCGDLNSRTGLFNVLHNTDFQDMSTSIFDEIRFSKDTKINAFGRSLLSLCSALDCIS